VHSGIACLLYHPGIPHPSESTSKATVPEGVRRDRPAVTLRSRAQPSHYGADRWTTAEPGALLPAHSEHCRGGEGG